MKKYYKGETVSNNGTTKSTAHKPVVLIVGTRPEGIKVIPLYNQLKKEDIPAVLCSTMQHDELLWQVFDLFDVTPDFNLQIMRHGQDLFYITQAILQKTKELFSRIQPSLVVVQGDTTSTMAAALAAFYLQIPIAHIEAGLRTGDISQPFPEEANRKLVTQLASYHFAPTKIAEQNLLAENIAPEQLFCVGNTVVDALRIIQEKIEQGTIYIKKEMCDLVTHPSYRKRILLTTHRRESFDGGITRILKTIKKYAQDNPDVLCIYPYHPNPHVLEAIEQTQLADLPNIYLSEPFSYKEMVYAISNAHLIITDSGGIQEEAISLNKPVLVLREKTERMEGVLAGLAKIVGTNQNKIEKNIYTSIANTSQNTHDPNANKTNIYGDGYSSKKITNIIKKIITQNSLNALPPELPTYEANKTGHSSSKNRRGNLPMKKVCVLGLGYIGLPTSLLLAEHGFDVIGFDVDAQRVASICAGDPVIEEPEIYEKLHIALQHNAFKATTTIEPADYFIIAVPTPFTYTQKGYKTETGLARRADLSYVKKAGQLIAKVLQKNSVVLLESTVPIGATKELAKQLAHATKLEAGIDFYVAHCPERVLPGKIFKELLENDRVIGGINHASSYQASLLYSSFVTGDIHLTDDKTAEMVKLVENSSRDAQIAFAHQVATMAQVEKLNPYEIIELANKHPRVNILKPTCGVGGHCIAIDPWFLVESFPNHSQFIQAARETNDKRPQQVLKNITKQITKWELAHNKKSTVLLLGLTYKPDVDDLRESPALLIAKQLCKDTEKNILVAEPNIRQHKLISLFKERAVATQEGIEQADIIVYLVAHTRFKIIDKKLLLHKTILDFCGITYKPKKRDGIDSHKIGMLDFFITNNKEEQVS